VSTPQAEAEALREQAELLKQTLEDIQNRISDLEKTEAQKEG
jgi:prefoldin subunit 5